MDHVLSEHGLRLTYLCDPYAIDELDQDRILDDLADDPNETHALPCLTRYRIAEHDHLVLVSERSSGRYLGFLGATDGATDREDFLLLATIFVAPAARGQNLMRRMLALAMLRIGGMRAAPLVLVAGTQQPICLREVARYFTGAVWFPDRDTAAINFHTATLAQRIGRAIRPSHRLQAGPTGRVLTILDLRAACEARILDDARRMYRAR